MKNGTRGVKPTISVFPEGPGPAAHLGAAADGTLPWLIAHTAVLGGLGWISYLHTLRRTRREGGLSPR